jgi:hypothetical protein
MPSDEFIPTRYGKWLIVSTPLVAACAMIAVVYGVVVRYGVDVVENTGSGAGTVAVAWLVGGIAALAYWKAGCFLLRRMGFPVWCSDKTTGA